jgi:hypothetical protein
MLDLKGSYSSDYVNYNLLGCAAMYSDLKFTGISEGHNASIFKAEE